MIYIDNRIGSKDLLSLMPKNSAELTHLEYGDAAFMGRGPGDIPIPVGIERKRLNDMLTSMTTGRLSGHQIPGLVMCYDVVYLVVEGLWRANPQSGLLEKPGRKGWSPVRLGARQFMAKELWSYLNTLQILAGVYVWRTGTARATAQWVTNLYHWWTSKPLDAHKSHMAKHVPFAKLTRSKQPFVQRAAEQLASVGTVRAKAVADHFGSVLAMALAIESDWTAIDGIGKTLAKRIMEEIHK